MHGKGENITTCDQEEGLPVSTIGARRREGRKRRRKRPS